MALAMQEKNMSTDIHFYCSSGGNAGLACATAAISLQRPATIVVPSSTSPKMQARLRALGAQVIERGAHWREADTWMRGNLMAEDVNGVDVPPFDDARIWDGHATMVDELERQMSAHGGYDGLICSVGGGGLLCGIVQGLHKHGRLESHGSSADIEVVPSPIRVLAMETRGAHSLAHSLEVGQLCPLPGGITSIASTLGAVQVCARVYEWASTYSIDPVPAERLDPRIPEETTETSSHAAAYSLSSSRSQCGIRSYVLDDAEAAMACVRLADDEKILVEPACGVGLAAVYTGVVRNVLFPDLPDAVQTLDTRAEAPSEQPNKRKTFAELNVVVVLCGGSGVDLESLRRWEQQYADDDGVKAWSSTSECL